MINVRYFKLPSCGHSYRAIENQYTLWGLLFSDRASNSRGSFSPSAIDISILNHPSLSWLPREKLIGQTDLPFMTYLPLLGSLCILKERAWRDTGSIKGTIDSKWQNFRKSLQKSRSNLVPGDCPNGPQATPLSLPSNKSQPSQKHSKLGTGARSHLIRKTY